MVVRTRRKWLARATTRGSTTPPTGDSTSSGDESEPDEEDDDDRQRASESVPESTSRPKSETEGGRVPTRAKQQPVREQRQANARVAARVARKTTTTTSAVKRPQNLTRAREDRHQQGQAAQGQVRQPRRQVK
ncbi:hypothetical protein QQS21_011020 [Conoideocrella luteorostrata]|uniref:Uncharacterized protein n=1 Tax=Conoideocrella luteorostrata TaxID=1105319 RepID=A0AAJ0CEY6_9HYPO|nr:hypothetical protein QQS21_011020 [Conoideocrella luteorostrata]